MPSATDLDVTQAVACRLGEGETAMEVRQGQKFAAITLQGASSQLSETVELAPGLAVAPAAPVQFDHLWTEWLGTLRAEAAAQANLVIIAAMDSSAPKVMDGENASLKQKVWWLFRSLLFMGVPRYNQGLLFHGANVEGVPSIRSIGDLDPYVLAYKGKPLRVSGNDVRTAYDIFGVLEGVWRNRQKYQRLKRGLMAFFKGLSEDEGYYRIHQSCRAIEALILPDQGKTAAQFVDRGQTFVNAKRIGQILEEIYELRCCVEHLHGYDEVYQGKPAADRAGFFALRARQAEAIARTAYKHVLLDPALLSLFEDDVSTRSFWEQSFEDRRRRWGKPTNIDGV